MIKKLINLQPAVNDAIEYLRPGAVYTLYDTNFLEWRHELEPPTWDEINNIIELIKNQNIFEDNNGTLCKSS